MQASLLPSAEEVEFFDGIKLSRQFESRLRVIARQATTVWFNCDRLDRLLAQYVGILENCELIYAIGADGKQLSSNISIHSIDVSAYGQNLSNRPYTVSLSVLNNPAEQGAFACRIYTSQVSLHPCATILYAVTSGSTLLGYIATDITQIPD
ncbi:MAG: hypothetical protein WBN40_04015 [Pseudomonadales bacterium]